MVLLLLLYLYSVDISGEFLYNVGIVTLRKRLRIRSVISVNYHFVAILCPFNLLIRFKCYNIV